MRWLACLGLASAVIACAGRREAPRSEAASTEEPAAEPSVTSASAEETSATANTNGGAPGAAPAAPHVMTLDERLAEAGDGDVAALRELLRSESGAPVPPARSDPADEDGVRRLPERAELLDAIHALLPTAHACSTEEVGAVTLEVVLAGLDGPRASDPGGAVGAHPSHRPLRAEGLRRARGAGVQRRDVHVPLPRAPR